LQKFSDYISVVTPPTESQGRNKTNGHYHLYPPCRPTDLV